MASTKVGGYFFVCIDCVMSRENGEHSPDRPASEPDVWALWEGQMHLVANAMGEGDTEHFSWNACEGCGSHLGGDRFRYAWFTE